ncbi:MAG: PA0069 family radical SAM protein [Alphaproteobacteria bacterium]
MKQETTKPGVHGRGALENPAGRFEKLATIEERDDDFHDPEDESGKRLPTTVFRDASRSVISTNDSPDIGMEASVNPYRGCEHGCIYCYARPTHEYFGLSAGLDFETKIFAKTDAPELLRAKLASKSWEPKVITFSGVTDCYQPIERKMKITRGCMQVLAAFRNPAVVITKNYLVTRDIDIFKEMAAVQAIAVNLSITTLDPKLARAMEPRASRPALRLRAVEELAKAGIPVSVMVAPIVPGLTEHEIPAILEAVANAGARTAHYTVMSLPYGVKDLFQTWIAEHYPDRAKKVLNRIREIRGGKLNDPRFGSRMKGEGVHADQVAQIFAHYKKRYGLDRRYTALSTAAFRCGGNDGQGELF